MQRKHLIAFTMATIFLLLGFNVINGQKHEQNRAASVQSTAPIASETSATVGSDKGVTDTSIANKPLGEQPKAIIDNVAADIEHAQQMDKDRLETSLNEAQ